jgi:Flp pilus assembly protein TadG
LVAFALVPMLLAAGVAIDFARGQQFKAALQGTVDAAALAGASAYIDGSSAGAAVTAATNSLAAGQANLPSSIGPITTTKTAATTTTSGGSPAYGVTVTASATVATTLLALFTATGSVLVSASATAINPAVVVNAGIGNFSSSAWDTNTIYWYIVPSDGSLPTLSAANIIYSNASGYNNNNPSVPAAQASQRIGFALRNVTGGNQSYGGNQYGGAQGSTHIFYSHLGIPSSDAYPAVSANCSLQTAQVTNPNNPPGVPSPGVCLPASPANAAPSCADLAGQTLKFFWNDMGGGTDDKDYNDAEYTMSCAPSGGNGSGPTGVVLTQ